MVAIEDLSIKEIEEHLNALKQEALDTEAVILKDINAGRSVLVSKSGRIKIIDVYWHDSIPLLERAIKESNKRRENQLYNPNNIEVELYEN